MGLSDLAFKTVPQACVIEADTAHQICRPALSGINGKFLAWSPTGKHIAFVDTAANLVISNPDGTEAVKLLENIPRDFLLAWR